MSEDRFPRESLRSRLAHLGIPREAHPIGALARMVPVQPGGAGLNGVEPDALAEALIYLIEAGVVRVPCRLEALPDLEWGAHTCQFYRTETDLLELLTVYFSRGLERGEYCLWVAPDREAALALRTKLASTVVDFDRFEGAMQGRACEDWYLDGSGELKAAGVLVAQLARMSDEALRAGYEGLRCAGWTGPLDRLHWRATAEYECEVNAALENLKVKAICAYPLLGCGERELANLRDSHQELVVKGDGWWHRVSAASASEASAVLAALQGGRQ
jgi:hypothetical protein